MTNNNNIFNNISYAQWLEEALKELIEFPVKGICISAVATTGEIYTNYHQVPMMDKVKIAGMIQQDAMIETLRVNGMINEEDEEGEEYGEEE